MRRCFLIHIRFKFRSLIFWYCKWEFFRVNKRQNLLSCIWGKYSTCRAGMCFLHMPSKESTIERCSRSLFLLFPFHTRVSWWLWLLFCHFRNAPSTISFKGVSKDSRNNMSIWAFDVFTTVKALIIPKVFERVIKAVSRSKFHTKAYKAVGRRIRCLSQAHIVCCWSGSGCLKHWQQVENRCEPCS